MNNISIELKKLNLEYSEVVALKDANLIFKKGSIHSIIGEHGAGKSSIAHILSGLVKPDSGEILIDGKKFTSLTPKIAINHGIHLVHQSLPLNPHFTIAENLFYSSKKSTNFSMFYKTKLQEEATQYLKKMGFEMNVNRLTKNLNLAEKAIIAILAKILDFTNVLILDESLDKVSITYYAKLTKILNNLKSKGCTIIIISHKIDRVYDIADTITIIKDSKILLTEDTKSIGKMQMIKMAYTQYSETPIYQNNVGSLYQLVKYNEAILEDLPANLIIVNNSGTLKLANKYFINNFKLKIENYIEKPVKLLFEKSQSTSLNILLDAINNNIEETKFHVTLEINNNKGIFNIYSSPIIDITDKIGNMIIFYDITIYNSLQEDNQLTDKLSSIGLLSAGVAHEINNPLEIISNYLTNIKFKYNNESLISIVNKLDKQVNYITKIVSNLQNFSTTEKMIPENVNIKEIINEMISLLKINAKLKNVNINISRENIDENYYIYVNENELKQVILNIMKNAFESIEGKGEINISINREVINESKHISIYFIDTGTGIDETKDYFNPFYSTKSANHKNTGLGLSLVYGIVSKYNGSISLNNRTDGITGCIVKVTFPEINEI